VADNTSDSTSGKKSSEPVNRRRALLVALVGAGVPLSERIIPGKWASPMVKSVVLPAHAETTNPPLVYPLRFGSANVFSSNDRRATLFTDVVNRTEEEILNLFVSAAEANTCSSNSCGGANAPVTVDVAATIDKNPTNTACVEARVTIDDAASCSSKCQMFTFDTTVNGTSVIVDGGCAELKLTNVTLSATELKGNYAYKSGNVDQSGQFTSPVNPGSGCGSLGCA